VVKKHVGKGPDKKILPRGTFDLPTPGGMIKKKNTWDSRSQYVSKAALNHERWCLNTDPPVWPQSNRPVPNEDDIGGT